MTPLEFYTLWDEHLQYTGVKKGERVSSIDDLP
jgi:hypothetical protein